MYSRYTVKAPQAPPDYGGTAFNPAVTAESPPTEAAVTDEADEKDSATTLISGSRHSSVIAIMRSTLKTRNTLSPLLALIMAAFSLNDFISGGPVGNLIRTHDQRGGNHTLKQADSC